MTDTGAYGDVVFGPIRFLRLRCEPTDAVADVYTEERSTLADLSREKALSQGCTEQSQSRVPPE
jgi:hypothetical protein